MNNLNSEHIPNKDDAELAAVRSSSIKFGDVQSRPVHPFVNLFKSNSVPSSIFNQAPLLNMAKPKQADEKPPVPFKEYEQLKLKYLQARRELDSFIRYSNKKIIRSLDRADNLFGNFKHIVKENPLSDGSSGKNRLFSIENQQSWEEIYSWAGTFTNYLKELGEIMPEKKKQLAQIVEQHEKEIVEMVKKEMNDLAKKILYLFREYQDEKQKELSFLSRAEQNLQEVMKRQQQEFQRARISLSREVVELTLKPLKRQIKDLVEKLKKIGEGKEKGQLFVGEESFIEILKAKGPKEGEKQEENKNGQKQEHKTDQNLKIKEEKYEKKKEENYEEKNEEKKEVVKDEYEYKYKGHKEFEK